MNTELHSKGMIINPDDLEKRELSHLGLEPSLREPASENASIQEIADSLHRHLPLLLHRLVVVRRDEDFPGGGAGIEQRALDHQPEEPVPVLEIVRVQE